MSYVSTIANLIQRQGDIAAEGAAARGQIWGHAVGNLGALASDSYQQAEAQKLRDSELALRGQQLDEAKQQTAMQAAQFATQQKAAFQQELGNRLLAIRNAPDPVKPTLWQAFKARAASGPPELRSAIPDGLPANDALDAEIESLLGPEKKVGVQGVGLVGERTGNVYAKEAKLPTEASLAADAATPDSPTAARSAAALTALQGPAQAREAETARHNAEMERISKLNSGREAAAQAETARHNRAIEGQNMPPAVSANPGINGDAFLQTLPTTQASLVKALAEGRMQFPSGFALKSPYWQGLLQAVGQYDPSFDTINYNARAKTRADFTSGASAKNINALNTVVGHLSDLSDKADALNNGDFQAINSLKNWVKTKTGSSDVTNFDTVKKAVGDELTRVWRQAGGTEADTQQWQQAIGSSNSPQQLHDAIATIGGLLESKLNALQEQYKQGVGISDVQVITPQARSALTKLEQRRGGGQAAPAASGPKEGQTQPIPGIPGAEATYRNGKWIRTK